MKRQRYTPAKIAAVKAACQMGLPWKLVSQFSGVPYLTIKDWMLRKVHQDVQPDQEFKTDLAYWCRVYGRLG